MACMDAISKWCHVQMIGDRLVGVEAPTDVASRLTSYKESDDVARDAVQLVADLN